MENPLIQLPDLSSEFEFQASRSSGPGGQNVNKVSSRVALRFNIARSALLTEYQKAVLLEKLASKIIGQEELQIVSQKERSQLMNKEACIRKLYEMLAKALVPQKKRKATRPGRAAIEKRIQEKKQQAEKKTMRGRIDY